MPVVLRPSGLSVYDSIVFVSFRILVAALFNVISDSSLYASRVLRCLGLALSLNSLMPLWTGTAVKGEVRRIGEMQGNRSGPLGLRFSVRLARGGLIDSFKCSSLVLTGVSGGSLW